MVKDRDRVLCRKGELLCLISTLNIFIKTTSTRHTHSHPELEEGLNEY